MGETAHETGGIMSLPALLGQAPATSRSSCASHLSSAAPCCLQDPGHNASTRARREQVLPTRRAAFWRRAGGVFWTTSQPWMKPWWGLADAVENPARVFRFAPSTCTSTIAIITHVANLPVAICSGTHPITISAGYSMSQ